MAETAYKAATSLGNAQGMGIWREKQEEACGLVRIPVVRTVPVSSQLIDSVFLPFNNRGKF